MKTYICKTCGKESYNKYNSVRIYCSRSCKNNDPELKAAMIVAQKETYQNKYGGHPMKQALTRERQGETMFKRYGHSHALQSKELLEKSKETKRMLYGDPFFNNQEKGESTKLEKYGSCYYNGHEKRTKKAIDKKVYEWEHIRILDYDYSIAIRDQVFTLQCTECETVWKGGLDNNYKPTCKFCSPNYQYTKVSKGHQEIIDFLNSILPLNSFTVNDRSILNGDELDIFIPGHNLAIEFNGIFFHSNLFKDKNYHLKKTSRCLARGIALIHIFDSLWWSDKDLIKSMLAAKLGIFQTRIYARKCTLGKVSPRDKKVFLEENHLQGTANSSTNIGLYYNNVLTSILTLGKPRFDTKADWEVIRFASRRGIQVIGGFSKMLSYFIKTYNPRLLMSYCDRTWSSGESYFRAGFSFDSFTVPNYYYFKNLEVYPRQMFQKHKLSKLLENFDITKTESENVLNNGYLRFWDCGNVKLYYNTLNRPQ